MKMEDKTDKPISFERHGRIKPTEIMKYLTSFMREITTGNTQSLLLNLENTISYMTEKLSIYEEIIEETTGKNKPILNDNQKRRLAQAGEQLNTYILSQIENTFSPGTVQRWYRELVGDKYNSVAPQQKKRGPKVMNTSIVDVIVFMGKQNRHWGYKRIAGYMRYLGYDVSDYAVKKVLDNHGISPNPDGDSKHKWKTFIDSHLEVVSSCDFATTELLINNTLVRYHILFFENLSTREVVLGGITHDPDANWTAQVGRNMCDCWDGKLLGKKYLVHDNDVLFGTAFHNALKGVDITPRKLPPKSPELNGHVESFIKTFKRECLDHFILTSEAQLRYVVHQWLEYYNHERPHSALNWNMIDPWPQDPDGVIQEFSRLGGLLLSYRRVARKNSGDNGDDDTPAPAMAFA